MRTRGELVDLSRGTKEKIIIVIGIGLRDGYALEHSLYYLGSSRVGVIEKPRDDPRKPNVMGASTRAVEGTKQVAISSQIIVSSSDILRR